MTLYKNFIGIKSIFYFCSLPLRLDTYKGCTHSCLYCFSQTLNNRKKGFFSSVIPAEPKQFARILEFTLSSDQVSGLVTSCLKHKVPIHLGCVSDPFQPIEAIYHVTKQIINILAKYQYPTVISTKSDMVSNQEFLSLFRDTPITIQISFSTFDDNLAAILEPNAPSPSRRLLAIERLNAEGIRTVARIQPFLFPFEQITEEKIRILSNDGVKHILLEHLRIPTNSSLASRSKLSNVLGADILDTYKNLGLKHSRVNYELETKIKLPNILYAKELAHSYGMTFGAGDNDFHHFSDFLCCCGIPQSTDFSEFYKGHLGKGLFDGIRTGIIDFSYIDDLWHPKGSIREYLNSDCRIKNKSSISDLLKDRIAKPNSSNSPSSFFGVMYDNDLYQFSSESLYLFSKRGGNNEQINN